MVRMMEPERSELWDRWEAGKSQRSIARALDRSPSTIRTRLLSSGWRRPIPAVEWCSLRLSLGEREEISRGIAGGGWLRSIADRLGRSSSAVSREVRINGGCSRYRAVSAHRDLGGARNVQRRMKFESCPRLGGVVEDKLGLWWSPAQISLWLETEYCEDEEMQVSHETIYQSLYVQGRGALRKELWQALRTGRARRRPQGCPGSGRVLVR
jgi:IS30 family transposase